MTSQEFCFWFQGFLELRGAASVTTSGMSERQVEIVKEHLSLVFAHEIDPSHGDPAHQLTLNAIHGENRPRC